ncbi:hypothetical protein GN956_G13696 [Arapaima gigas]
MGCRGGERKQCKWPSALQSFRYLQTRSAKNVAFRKWLEMCQSRPHQTQRKPSVWERVYRFSSSEENLYSREGGFGKMESMWPATFSALAFIAAEKQTEAKIKNFAEDHRARRFLSGEMKKTEAPTNPPVFHTASRKVPIALEGGAASPLQLQDLDLWTLITRYSLCYYLERPGKSKGRLSNGSRAAHCCANLHFPFSVMSRHGKPTVTKTSNRRESDRVGLGPQEKADNHYAIGACVCQLFAPSAADPDWRSVGQLPNIS